MWALGKAVTVSVSGEGTVALLAGVHYIPRLPRTAQLRPSERRLAAGSDLEQKAGLPFVYQDVEWTPAFTLPPQPSKDENVGIFWCSLLCAELLARRVSGPWKAPMTKLIKLTLYPQSQQALWPGQCSQSASDQCRGDSSPPLNICKTISFEQTFNNSLIPELPIFYRIHLAPRLSTQTQM